MWFASELNGKDHLERIHSFTEGRGYSFYDCLRQFGLEWFGRRSFFDQRDTAGQALWSFLQTGPVEHPHVHVLQSRGAVSSVSIASTDLLYYVEPLPLDQFIHNDTQTISTWPETARQELIAVARWDIAVARRYLASMTRYVDMQDAHLAACSGALDDNIPLMSVETFPRVTGGIRLALDKADRTT